MKKLIPVLVLLLSLIWLTSCSKEQHHDPIILDTPEQSTIVTEDLTIQLKGRLLGEDMDYVFYQMEDGHSFLGSGRIDRDQDGEFDIQIKLDKPPDHQYIGLYFYPDENKDGEFDPPIDTLTELKKVDLQYQPSN